MTTLTRDQIDEAEHITEQDISVYKDIENFELVFKHEDKFYVVNAARNNYEGTDYGPEADPYNNRQGSDDIEVYEVKRTEQMVVVYQWDF